MGIELKYGWNNQLLQKCFSVEQDSSKTNFPRLCLAEVMEGLVKAALVCGVAGGKTVEGMIRASTFSSLATQLCFQKFKKIKMNMNFLKRIKQILVNVIIKLCNMVYGFDH